jgi:hypothetical protein
MRILTRAFSFLAGKKAGRAPVAEDRRCLGCVHFHNSPEYLEKAYPGLKIMSSGYASVRKDDGICELHELYLSAEATCEQYQHVGKSRIGD